MQLKIKKVGTGWINKHYSTVVQSLISLQKKPIKNKNLFAEKL